MPDPNTYGKLFDNGVQTVFNASSINDYLKCPQYYDYTWRQRWRSDHGKSFHLRFGGHIADALQEFYLIRAAGGSREDAIRAAVHKALIESWNHDLSPEGERIPNSGSAWETFDPKKNRQTLIRTIIWYFEEYKDDLPVLRIGDAPAVEQKFRLDLEFTTIVGTIDRVVKYSEGSNYLMDQKTTAAQIGPYWFDQWKPNLQFAFYTFAGQMILPEPVKGFIIDGIQLAVGSTRFGRGTTFYQRSELEEFLVTLKDTVEDIHRDSERNRFAQNPNACDAYAGCVFRKICSRPPSARKNFFAADFHQEPET